MSPPSSLRWCFGLSIAVLVSVVPFAHFRCVYNRGKRLREVTPGVLYRSGQLTAEGFRSAVARYGIRTIINLQDEYPDPLVATESGWPRTASIRETDLCRELGVRYVYIAPDLIPRRYAATQRPVAIERLLAVMDDTENLPVLVHCRAGLHRTGVMVAVYRMEYEGWTPREAVGEVRRNGFGDWACTSANDYILEYVLTYRRGVRQLSAAPVAGDERP